MLAAIFVPRASAIRMAGEGGPVFLLSTVSTYQLEGTSIRAEVMALVFFVIYTAVR